MELFDVNNIVTLKSGLEVTQGHSKWYHLKVRYGYSFLFAIHIQVTMAVALAISEIFSIKEWPDLEILVRGHSRSLKLVPFGSLGVISYSHSIVTMAISCILCEI